MKVDPCLTPVNASINSKQIVDLNFRAKPVRLRINLGLNVFYFELGNGFSNMSLKPKLK